jgi:tetratricopeptide (TPR) repeat protein
MTAAADSNVPEPADRGTQIFRICIGLVLATWFACEPLLRSEFAAYADAGGLAEGGGVLAGISRMLDIRTLGLGVGGLHVVNLVLHIANVLLVFGLLTSATGALWRSAFVAVLFGIHPLHVEPVAWISERKEVVATLFGLLALWAYVAYARRGGVGRLLGTAALVSVALVANPMWVTLPLVFLLFDTWPLDRLRRDGAASVLIEKIPFLALAAVSGAIAWVVLRQAGGPAEPASLSLRAANALASYAWYAAKTLWPADLSIVYPHSALPGGTPWAAWQVAGAGLLLVGISVLAARRRYALTGWLWYLVTLLPVIGLLPVGPQAIADRHAYVPLIGLFVIGAWGGGELLAKIPSHRTAARRAAVACAVALLLVSLLWTRVQALFWTNPLMLYARVLNVDPTNSAIHYKVAMILGAEGRVEKAVAHYRRALEADPGHAGARYNLATTLAEGGEVDESIDEYRRLLETQPDFAEAHNNLGALLERRGDRDEAVVHYQRALEVQPDYPEAHFNWGNALLALGESDEAIEHYRGALEIRPDYFQAHFNLGNALVDRGEPDEAIEHFRESLRLNPDFALGYFSLANSLVAVDATDEAIVNYREALRRKPDFARAHNNLGSALVARGDIDEAIDHFREALAVNPELTAAQDNLDRLLEGKDTAEQAP